MKLGFRGAGSRRGFLPGRNRRGTVGFHSTAGGARPLDGLKTAQEGVMRAPRRAILVARSSAIGLKAQAGERRSDCAMEQAEPKTNSFGPWAIFSVGPRTH